MWDAAARGWERSRDRMWESSHAVGEGLVEMAAPAPGESVLEIAAGPGDTGFLAAELIGESGRLVATDLSTRMLAAAERRAAELGLRNVEFRQVDAQAMDLESASFDVALCRWGLMLMPDPAVALAETRRVLRPGGRLALAVWGPREANPWNTTIQGAFGESRPAAAAGRPERAGHLPAGRQRASWPPSWLRPGSPTYSCATCRCTGGSARSTTTGV